MAEESFTIKTSTDTLEYDALQLRTWYAEYLKIGGKHSMTTYQNKINKFFEITHDAYIFGDLTKPDGSSWEGRGETYMYWMEECKLKQKEAARYFTSIDNVTSYTQFEV